MVAGNNRDDILRLMIRVGRIQIYIIGLVCVGFICTGRDFIIAWLGDGFSEAYICALMIILPSFLHLPQEIGSTTIVAEGKVKHQAYAFLVMAAVNLLLAFPLTKMYGIKGLCFSIMIAYLVRTVLMDFIFYKELQINVITFFRESYLRILPALLCSIAITLFIIHFIALEGWLGFIVKAVVCLVVYAVSVSLLSMNQDEKHLIIVPIKKVIHRK